MRRMRVLFIFIAAILLAGCRPASYSSDDKKTLTKAHAGEAEAWFAEHLPEAKVKSAEIYADGMEILSIIEGTYVDGGKTYHYAYDYHNGEMYFDRYYEETMQALLSLTAEALQEDAAKIAYNPLYLCVETVVEKTSEESPDTRIATLDRYVPARNDYEEYAKEILLEGKNEQVSLICFVYTDSVPDYDSAVFEELRGLHNLIYMAPIETPTEDVIYRAKYEPQKAEYAHVVMEEAAENLTAGYCYKVTESFAEDGSLLERTDEIEGKDPSLILEAREDGSLVMKIPAGLARPIVLAEKAKEYRGKTESTGDRYFVWREAGSLGDKGYFDGPYDYYMDGFIFKKSDLILYTYNSSREESGNYSFYTE